MRWNGASWLWNHPARETTELSQTYVVDLEQMRDKLWSEVQTLGKAWEQHVDYIKAQQKHIDNLEARCTELRVALHDTLGGTTGISSREYRLGGRDAAQRGNAWTVATGAENSTRRRSWLRGGRQSDDRQALATLEAAGLDDFATAGSGHPGTVTNLAGALLAVRAECRFHGS